MRTRAPTIDPMRECGKLGFPLTLALDLGNSTGWAIRDANGTIHSGTWVLNSDGQSHDPRRFLRLQARLSSLHAQCGFERIIVERPGMCRSTAAAETLYGLLGIVLVFAVERRIPFARVVPQHVKKHAVGKGNANKVQMVAAAKENWPDQAVRDDNQADALWLLDYWTSKEAEIDSEETVG